LYVFRTPSLGAVAGMSAPVSVLLAAAARAGGAAGWLLGLFLVFLVPDWVVDAALAADGSSDARSAAAGESSASG